MEIFRYGIWLQEDKLCNKRSSIRVEYCRLDFYQQKLFLRFDFVKIIMTRHGKEGCVFIMDLSSSSYLIKSKYECGSLTFCKASIADAASTLLFVPMLNDSVTNLYKVYKWIDRNTRYPRKINHLCISTATDEGNGDGMQWRLFFNLYCCLWIRKCSSIWLSNETVYKWRQSIWFTEYVLFYLQYE